MMNNAPESFPMPLIKSNFSSVFICGNSSQCFKHRSFLTDQDAVQENIYKRF